MCNYKEQVFLYQEGVLSIAEANRVEQHLKHCKDCELQLRQLRDLSGMMQDISLPVGNKEQLRQKLFDPPPQRLFILRPAFAVSFALLIFMSILIINPFLQKRRSFSSPLKKSVYNEIIGQINKAMTFRLSAVKVNFLGQDISFSNRTGIVSKKSRDNSKKRKIIFNVIYKNISNLIREATILNKGFAAIWKKASFQEKDILKQKVLNSEYQKYLTYFRCTKQIANYYSDKGGKT